MIACIRVHKYSTVKLYRLDFLLAAIFTAAWGRVRSPHPIPAQTKHVCVAWCLSCPAKSQMFRLKCSNLGCNRTMPCVESCWELKHFRHICQKSLLEYFELDCQKETMPLFLEKN